MRNVLTGHNEQIARQKSKDIKGWVHETLQLAPEAAIIVTELTCSEPGCPPLETVIAVLRGPGDQLQQKIHRSLADITKEDVVALCARFQHSGTSA